MTLTTCTDIVKAALYQRVSTKDQEAGRQNAANRQVAERESWQATEYEDQVSASRFANGKARADYERLLADITAGRVNVVVLWEASRGSRELEQWAHLLNACRRHGALIHVTSHGRTYDMTNGRDWRTLAEDGVDSAYESEKMSVRITAGKAEGRQKGRPQGGIAYGVHRVRDPEKTKRAFLRDEPDPVTGPVVARIVREVGRGTPYKELTAALNAEGIPPPTVSMNRGRPGARWHQTTVTKIAGNPAYVAAGVVTEQEHQAARARLAETASKRTRPGGARYRYSATIACSVCGVPLRGAHKAGMDRYLCAGGHVSIPAAELDSWVNVLVVERLSRPDTIGLIRQADTGAAALAWAEAAGYRERIETARTSYAGGRIEIEDLEAIKADLAPKIAAAEQRARDAETPSALVGLPDEDRAVVAQRWASLTLAARKEAVRVLAPDAVAFPTRKFRPAPISERVVLWPDLTGR